MKLRYGLAIILCWGAFRLLRAAARIARHHALVTALQEAGEVMGKQIREEMDRRAA